MTIICISGTPCTGKTTLAKKLSKQFNYEYVNVNKLIKDNKLDEKYDRRKKCYVVDVKKLNKLLIKLIQTKKNLVIDSHLSHYLPRKYVDLCIITKCSLKTLERRLKRRKYIKSKIRENLDCEIFDVCLNEARENKHKILEIDTSKQVNIKNIKIK